jgi:hypothetical protein
LGALNKLKKQPTHRRRRTTMRRPQYAAAAKSWGDRAAAVRRLAARLNLAAEAVAPERN